MTVADADRVARARRPLHAQRRSGDRVGLLAFAALLSLAVGARSIPLADVVDALLHGGNSQERGDRPQTCACRGRCSGSLVGAAIGVAGALMQALTRNPLADPGLLASTPARRRRS